MFGKTLISSGPD